MAADSTKDADLQRVRAHVNQLKEHFDSVQIFCTKPSLAPDGGTVSINVGAGDFFARYGKAREWVLKEEHNFRAEAEDGDGD